MRWILAKVVLFVLLAGCSRGDCGKSSTEYQLRGNAATTGLLDLGRIADKLPLRWNHQFGERCWSSFHYEQRRPAVARDLIIAPASDGWVYALRASDGTTAWKHEVGCTRSTSSALTISEGMVFVGVTSGLGGRKAELRALRVSDGSLLWSYQMEMFPTGSPAVYDNVVVFSDGFGTVYALDKTTGQEQWKQKVGLSIHLPVVIADGAVFVHSMNDKLLLSDYSNPNPQDNQGKTERVVALELLDGRMRWEVALKNMMYPLAVSDGMLVGWYFEELLDGPPFNVENKTYLVGIDTKSGRVVWLTDEDKRWFGAPVVVGDRLVIAARTKPGTSGLHGDEIVSHEMKTGRKLWSWANGSAFLGELYATSEGVVAVDNIRNRIYVLRAEDGQLIREIEWVGVDRRSIDYTVDLTSVGLIVVGDILKEHRDELFVY